MFLPLADKDEVTSEPIIVSNEDGQIHESVSILPPTIDRSQEDDESDNIDRLLLTLSLSLSPLHGLNLRILFAAPW